MAHEGGIMSGGIQTEDQTVADSEGVDRARQVNFRAGDLAEPLSEYPGAPGNAAKTLISRYVSFVRDGLRLIREGVALSEAEALVVCDALHGMPLEPITIPLVPEAIRQMAVIRRAGQDQGVNGQALVDRIASLDTALTFALLDAVERYWHLEARIPNPVERLRAVGLIDGVTP